jgi:DNA polymerase-1
VTLSDYERVWVLDTEYGILPGHHPNPVCLCAREIRTGAEIRIWRTDAHTCPFTYDESTLFVGFNISSEWSVFLVWNWPLPTAIIDLMVEHSNLHNHNGLRVTGEALLDVLRNYGLQGISAQAKDHGRSQAMRIATLPEPTSESERRELLEYCFTDVDETEHLFNAMVSYIDFPRALLRGRYTCAAARMEHVGLPIDVGLHTALMTHRIDLQRTVVQEASKRIPVFEGLTFKYDLFEKWLAKQGLAWPLLESGRLELKDDVFGKMQFLHPDLPLLRDARNFLSQLRETGYPLSPDARTRTHIFVFGMVTGRNNFRNSEFPFTASSWSRVLIKPKIGYGLAYIDYSQQEIGIASALSGDLKMQESYQKDFYFHYAQLAGEIPAGIPYNAQTKKQYKSIRDQFKAVALGSNYGISEYGLANQMSVSIARARQLLNAHQEIYSVYHKWLDAVVDHAFLEGWLRTVFGWKMQFREINKKGRSACNTAKNFLMQANGAEMLRLACIGATEAGIQVCAPVHDALLIESPLESLEEAINITREIMRRASLAVLKTMEIRTDVKRILYPNRYEDERNIKTWHTVRNALLKNGWWTDS